MVSIARIPLRELKGRRVVLAKEIMNRGGDVFPAGTIMEINDKWKGWGLQEVGSRRYIRCVDEESFSILPISDGR